MRLVPVYVEPAGCAVYSYKYVHNTTCVHLTVEHTYHFECTRLFADPGNVAAIAGQGMLHGWTGVRGREY